MIRRIANLNGGNGQLYRDAIFLFLLMARLYSNEYGSRARPDSLSCSTPAAQIIIAELFAGAWKIGPPDGHFAILIFYDFIQCSRRKVIKRRVGG